MRVISTTYDTEGSRGHGLQLLVVPCASSGMLPQARVGRFKAVTWLTRREAAQLLAGLRTLQHEGGCIITAHRRRTTHTNRPTGHQ